MWYLYMMIGVYLLTPIIIRWKSELDFCVFSRIIIIFVIFACLSCWTSTYEFNWDIGRSFCYTGYFCMWYVIRKKIGKTTKNFSSFLCILSGICLLLILAIFQYYRIMQGISETEERLSIVEPQNPVVLVASLLIFIGFTKLQINANLGFLATKTFYIYLFHGGVWKAALKIVRRIDNYFSSYTIPLCIVGVFLLSLLFAYLYDKVWKWICKLLHRVK